MSDAVQADASKVGEAEPSAGEERAQEQQQDESSSSAPAKEQEEQSNGGGAKASAGGGFDDATKRTVQKIPLLRTRAGPRDGDAWNQRLREELQALIQYVKTNKESDNDWFRIESNKTGTRWTGKCWSFYKGIRYEFELHFEIPVTYPVTNPDLCLPELEGKTAKMYRGGKICLTEHFQPLWQRNVPRFGIAHALALGLGPWLAAEVPSLVDGGFIEAS